MRIELENKLEEVPVAIAAAEKFLSSEGVDRKAIQVVELSLDELLTNTISYGYGDPGLHQIVLLISVEDKTLTILLEDDAIEFNPLEKSKPQLDLPIEERPLGGLGIYLVKKFMDTVTYQRKDGKNIISLQKKF